MKETHHQFLYPARRWTDTPGCSRWEESGLQPAQTVRAHRDDQRVWISPSLHPLWRRAEEEEEGERERGEQEIQSYGCIGREAIYKQGSPEFRPLKHLHGFRKTVSQQACQPHTNKKWALCNWLQLTTNKKRYWHTHTHTHARTHTHTHDGTGFPPHEQDRCTN